MHERSLDRMAAAPKPMTYGLRQKPRLCSSSKTIPSCAATLAYNLTREGFRVLTAADGEAGLEQARQERGELDLVVLDVMLPGISGFQVLRALRGRNRHTRF